MLYCQYRVGRGDYPVSLISHLDFEIGGDFLGIWGLCILNGHKNRVLVEKLGLFASLGGAKIGFFGGLLNEKWGKYFWVNTR